jgi:glycosyltransferase involved in cell wall biosynthesis
MELSRSIKVKSTTLANFAPFPPKNISHSPYSNYFLFVGKLEKSKGVMNLVKAFGQIREKTDARLLIAGEGSLEDPIKRFIEQNSLDDLVICIGFIPNGKLYSFRRDARALIIPSTGPENSPLVALEALSVGTPVIASNVGGLPEIVSKVDNRLIFDDLTELEDILVNFHEKDYPRTRIQDIYNANFSPAIYVDKYLRAISDQSNGRQTSTRFDASPESMNVLY